jgi:hypothetical protein
MVLGSTAAMAGPSDKVVYGATFGPVTINAPVNQHNQFPGNAIVGTADFLNGLAGFFGGPDAMAARYEQESTVTGNTETATPTVSVAFSLSGTVDKDCSFYSGGASTQAINLGTIGVQTGNNVNSSLAFDQAGPINAHINTSTAGCNTQNQVTITKANGAAGLLNTAAIAYDTAQFTNKIPYSVVATWTGVGLGVPAAGTTQTLTAATTDAFKAVQVGAWRSSFDMNVNAPVPALGLIAGTYADTITVELKAL